MNTGEAGDSAGMQQRIKQLSAKQKEAHEMIATLQAELAASKKAGEGLADITAERDQLRSDLASAQSAAVRSDALAAAGVSDSDSREWLGWRYDRLAPEDRPEFGAWLSELAENPTGMDKQIFRSTAQAAPESAGTSNPAPEPKPEPKPAPGGVNTESGNAQPVLNGGRRTAAQLRDPNLSWTQVLEEWRAS